MLFRVVTVGLVLFVVEGWGKKYYDNMGERRQGDRQKVRKRVGGKKRKSCKIAYQR
jgi:hypothetical protein